MITVTAGRDGDASPAARQFEAANRRHRRIVLSVLIAIVVSGAALRLHHIGYQSLWWDEAASMVVAKSPARDTFNYFKLDADTPRPSFGWTAPAPPVWELNPPVYFMALHGWLALFGAGPVSRPA